MSYATVDEAPSIYQWDDSSRQPPPDPGSAPQNCAPTCVTFIAAFYRDTTFGINATRLLAAPNHAATNITQQRTMLARRGVPCTIGQPSVLTMRGLVASGRRPILIGLDMSRVPLATAGHPFRGMHALVLRRTRIVNGVRGFDALDPNFSRRTGRLDPTNGHRFYSEAQVDAAFRESDGRRSWALIPSAEKRPVVAPGLPDTSIPSEDQIDMAILDKIGIPGDTGRLFGVQAGVTLRKGPGAQYAKHFTTTGPIKYRLLGFSPGGWVAASNPNSPTGIFFVPPAH